VKRKIQQALDAIVNVVREWEAADTLTLIQLSDDLYDPYFFISLDLYFRGEIPGAAERSVMFDFTGGFESSGINRKDRFLLDDIPFRIEYKDISRFDTIIHDSLNQSVAIRDSGTYMFHRIVTSEVIFRKSGWIESARSDLAQLPGGFWAGARTSSQVSMEHYLGDLAAAVMREDELFYVYSLSGFIKSALRTVFSINRRFEPSPRQLKEEALLLDVLPDSFQGLLESLLRHEDRSWTRKREIAELLAKRIVQL
jgi:hypothetical protein